MKYFIGGYDDSVFSGFNVEVTREYAWNLYKNHAGGGNQRLVARPNFNRGLRVRLKHYDLWGENISNAECFQRRLAGKLATEIRECTKDD